MSHRDTIHQRDAIYGDFGAIATTAITLRQTIMQRMRTTNRHADPAEVETLNMICTKLARIANAPLWTPDVIDVLIDHYHDIAGYAALAETQLRQIRTLLTAKLGERPTEAAAPAPSEDGGNAEAATGAGFGGPPEDTGS